MSFSRAKLTRFNEPTGSPTSLVTEVKSISSDRNKKGSVIGLSPIRCKSPNAAKRKMSASHTSLDCFAPVVPAPKKTTVEKPNTQGKDVKRLLPFSKMPRYSLRDRQKPATLTKTSSNKNESATKVISDISNNSGTHPVTTSNTSSTTTKAPSRDPSRELSKEPSKEPSREPSRERSISRSRPSSPALKPSRNASVDNVVVCKKSEDNGDGKSNGGVTFSEIISVVIDDDGECAVEVPTGDTEVIKLKSRPQSRCSVYEGQDNDENLSVIMVKSRPNSASVIDRQQLALTTGIPIAVSRKNSGSMQRSSTMTSFNKVTSKPCAISGAKSYIPLTKRTLESQFFSKKRKLNLMRRDLLTVQEPVLDMYNVLLELRTKIKESSGKSVPLEELHIITATELDTNSSRSGTRFTREPLEVKLLTTTRPLSAPNGYGRSRQQQHHAGAGEKLAMPIDDVTMKHMEDTLKDIPSTFMKFCESVLNSHTKIVEWVSNADHFQDTSSAYVTVFKVEGEHLRSQFDSIVADEEYKIKGLLKKWTDLYLHRQDLDETKQLHEKLLQLNASKEMLEVEKKDLHAVLKELENTLQMKKTELDMEKCKYKYKDDKIAALENKLRVARQKIKDAEAKKQLDDAKMDQLHVTIKELEEQIKVKESSKNARVKEEVAIKLKKERAVFESRFKEARDEYEANVRELQNKALEMEQRLHEAETDVALAKDEAGKCESKFREVRDRLVASEVKNQQFEHQRNAEVSKTSVNVELHTQGEINLWTELQATRVALKAAEDKLAKKCDERVRFIKTIDKAVIEKNNTPEGWAAQLIKKDDCIEQLQEKINTLSDTILYSHDIAFKQEKKIKDLEEKLILNTNEIKKDNSDELAKTIQDISRQLEESLGRISELELKLLERDHALSTTQNKLREMENQLKTRDGIINIMKSKKKLSSNELNMLKQYSTEMTYKYNKINSDIESKSDMIKNLCINLESEQQKCNRLEETVNSMKSFLVDSQKENTVLKERLRQLDETVKDMKDRKDMGESIVVAKQQTQQCRDDAAGEEAKTRYDDLTGRASTAGYKTKLCNSIRRRLPLDSVSRENCSRAGRDAGFRDNCDNRSVHSIRKKFIYHTKKISHTKFVHSESSTVGFMPQDCLLNPSSTTTTTYVKRIFHTSSYNMM